MDEMLPQDDELLRREKVFLGLFEKFSVDESSDTEVIDDCCTFNNCSDEDDSDSNSSFSDANSDTSKNDFDITQMSEQLQTMIKNRKDAWPKKGIHLQLKTVDPKVTVEEWLKTNEFTFTTKKYKKTVINEDGKKTTITTTRKTTTTKKSFQSVISKGNIRNDYPNKYKSNLKEIQHEHNTDAPSTNAKQKMKKKNEKHKEWTDQKERRAKVNKKMFLEIPIDESLITKRFLRSAAARQDETANKVSKEYIRRNSVPKKLKVAVVKIRRLKRSEIAKYLNESLTNQNEMNNSFKMMEASRSLSYKGKSTIITTDSTVQKPSKKSKRLIKQSEAAQSPVKSLPSQVENNSIEMLEDSPVLSAEGDIANITTDARVQKPSKKGKRLIKQSEAAQYPVKSLPSQVENNSIEMLEDSPVLSAEVDIANITTDAKVQKPSKKGKRLIKQSEAAQSPVKSLPSQVENNSIEMLEDSPVLFAEGEIANITTDTKVQKPSKKGKRLIKQSEIVQSPVKSLLNQNENNLIEVLEDSAVLSPEGEIEIITTDTKVKKPLKKGKRLMKLSEAAQSPVKSLPSQVENNSIEMLEASPVLFAEGEIANITTDTKVQKPSKNGKRLIKQSEVVQSPVKSLLNQNENNLIEMLEDSAVLSPEGEIAIITTDTKVKKPLKKGKRLMKLSEAAQSPVKSLPSQVENNSIEMLEASPVLFAEGEIANITTDTKVQKPSKNGKRLIKQSEVVQSPVKSLLNQNENNLIEMLEDSAVLSPEGEIAIITTDTKVKKASEKGKQLIVAQTPKKSLSYQNKVARIVIYSPTSTRIIGKKINDQFMRVTTRDLEKRIDPKYFSRGNNRNSEKHYIPINRKIEYELPTTDALVEENSDYNSEDDDILLTTYTSKGHFWKIKL